MKNVKLFVVVFWLIFSGFISLIAEDYPIIFVHGSNGEGNNEIGWSTWNHSSSAMMRILNEQYGGYEWGITSQGDIANKCNKNTQLAPMPDKRRIYNFSFYNPDNSRGVIGSNGKYVPANYTDEYVTSANNGCWAKHLADFIDKVLAATGASKVNIVAHPMGGLVARAAIAYYGCANKVNKLLTLGTPHHAFEEDAFIEALVANVFLGYKSWQKMGELLEMGINFWGPIYGGVLFWDQSHQSVATWCDWLYSDDPQVTTSAIAGNKEQWWSTPFAANDGLVKVSQAHLDYACFNPTIYATHSRDWTGDDELALVTSTYTTEFIKKWMIDNEDTYYGAYFIDKPSVAVNFPPYSLRVWPKINDYKKALTIDIFLIRPDNGSIVKKKTVPIFRCHQEYLPRFIGAPVITTDWREQAGGYSGYVIVKVVINDMQVGKKAEKSG